MSSESVTKELLLEAVRIGAAIVEAVRVAGPLGAPGGVLFAALSSKGCTFPQFERIMGGFVSSRILAKSGECYTLGPRAADIFAGKRKKAEAGPVFREFALYPLSDIPNEKGFRLTLLDAFSGATWAIVATDEAGLHYCQGCKGERLKLSDYTAWTPAKGGALLS